MPAVAGPNEHPGATASAITKTGRARRAHGPLARQPVAVHRRWSSRLADREVSGEVGERALGLGRAWRAACGGSRISPRRTARSAARPGRLAPGPPPPPGPAVRLGSRPGSRSVPACARLCLHGHVAGDDRGPGIVEFAQRGPAGLDRAGQFVGFGVPASAPARSAKRSLARFRQAIISTVTTAMIRIAISNSRQGTEGKERMIELVGLGVPLTGRAKAGPGAAVAERQSAWLVGEIEDRDREQRGDDRGPQEPGSARRRPGWAAYAASSARSASRPGSARGATRPGAPPGH